MRLHIVTAVLLQTALLANPLGADPMLPTEPAGPDLPALSTADERPSALPDAPGRELTEAGRRIRGLYVPWPKARAWRKNGLVDWVVAAGATAAVIDAKDDWGRVTFPSRIADAGTPRIPDLADLVAALKARGIYTIGRVVCFKDNELAVARPAVALRTPAGTIYRDRGRHAWVDPHSAEVHDRLIAIAVAARQLGFDEIQLDYVRFPVERSALTARFPARRGNPARHEVLAGFLARLDAALDGPISLDVFGLTALRKGDTDGLGQSLEHLAPHVDALSPMLYLANMPASYWQHPTPEKTAGYISQALRTARERLGPGIALRPLLQGFAWRADNYGPAFVAQQIATVEAAGSDGHLFWNLGGHYAEVATVWRRTPPPGAVTEAGGPTPGRAAPLPFLAARSPALPRQR